MSIVYPFRQTGQRRSPFSGALEPSPVRSKIGGPTPPSAVPTDLEEEGREPGWA